MLIDFLVLIASLIVIFIIFYTWNYDYWKKRSIPYEKPFFPFGSIKDALLARKTLCSVLNDCYQKYKDYKYFGVYFGRHPVLFVRDSQLARDVMVKYFNHFQDNTININEKSEPLVAKNPFVLKGEQWRSKRGHLTPGFTALKLKQMFPHMVAVSERLVAYLHQQIDSSQNSIEAKEVASCFATEVFTLSALNITSDSFENPKSSFKTIAKTMLEGSNLLAFITWTVAIVDPGLSVLLRTKILTKEGADYFRKAVNDVLVHRETNNIVVNDIFNHFYTLYQKNADFTKDDLVSNVVTLFIDGVETSATTIRGILYEIAAQPRVFKKLRKEIDTILNKNNNKFTYDGIQEMTYLDSCISEGLRICSAVLFAMRQCTLPFEFPSQKDGEPGVKIDKGISVVLPFYSIHYDENLYPNPEEYKPERFYDDETKVQAKANLFGFGDGPRICLGMRYGTMVTRLGLATIISKFDVTVNEKSKERAKNIGPSFLFAPNVEPIVDFHKRGTIYKDNMLVDFLLLLASLIGILCIIFTWKYDYWKKRGIPYEKPVFPFGSIKDSILGKKTFSTQIDKFYYKYKDYKYFGLHFGRLPVLFIRDSQLGRDIMVKHFNHFQDNAIRLNAKADPVAGNNPFVLKGNKWKTTRAHLTPGFTSLKLKQMFPNMESVSKRFVAYIQQNINASNNKLEAKEVASNFTTEVFTLAALNIKSDSFENPNSSFKTIANTMFESSGIQGFITWMLMTVDPPLLELIGTRLMTKEGNAYFRNAVNDVLNHREKNNLQINDFLNYLHNLHLKNKDFTRDDVLANIVTLFIDGVETSAAAIRSLLYELAANPRVFEKLREEIDTVKAKYNNEITFDAIQEMAYLDSCLSESLRINTVLLTSMRECTQPFEFPPQKDGTAGLKIDKGVSVLIPLYCIHRDPTLYPNPEEFKPERFYDEETKDQAKANFFGFGDGPRMCLGMRYGSLVTKLAIATIVSNFDFTVNEKIKERPKHVGPSFIYFPSEEPIIDFHNRGTIYKDK
ncbi:uncharacterized protein LOC123296229 [Chrysoperla carnea]|uniref:uncharacterized protein LOC123296229 n=1 Tax=Chrysoperla carnea TaxID=189513 RepID=UPI001D0985C8|nr:uncharacterized protein LOC123296229 [Chrysoperla carnea]